jgi:hypothetical protein
MMGMSMSMASQHAAGASSGFPAAGASIDMDFVGGNYFGGTLANLMNVDQTQATGALLTLLTNNSGGTLVVSLNILPFTPVTTEFWIDNQDASNKFIYGNSATAARSAAGVSILNATLGSSANFTVSPIKVGVAWDGTGRSLCANGGAVAGNAVPFTGVTTSILINPSLVVLRDCRRWTAYTTRLDNATLQAATL